MLIEIIGKNGFEPTEAIKAYGIKKLDKVLKFIHDDHIDLRMVLKVYPNFHKVELTILGYKHTIRAEEKAEDMYAAIDLAVDKAVKQIKTYEDKKHRIKKQKDDTNQTPLDEIEKDVLANQLIRNKNIILKPMKVEEAIEHMEMLGHDFFIFLDDQTHQAHVVYKRDDGNFAVIETKV
jgi:putative sigma-54 modulation protein